MKQIKVLCNPLSLLGILLLVFFFFMVMRNAGLYPGVFADEYTYSRFSRLLPLDDASIPAYLYLKLYGITSYCGDGFLECARIINAAFFVFSAPFIFLICRRVADDRVSVFITLLSVLGPINSYTAYFMPESFYFFGFWFFAWWLLNLRSSSTGFRWFLAGFVFGLSALIKPHSMLYFPAVALYIAFVFYRTQNLFSKSFIFGISCFLLGALVAKFGISYILAGTAGLTLFGPFYEETASSSVIDFDKFISLVLLALESLKGHFLILVLIYGLPFVIAVLVILHHFSSRVRRFFDRDASLDFFEKVSILSLLVILNLVCVVSLFTASVADAGPYETPYRLHMRYYNFMLPLFYVIAAGALSEIFDVKRGLRYAIGFTILFFGIYVAATNFSPYTPSHVDSPEIWGFYIDKLAFKVVIGFLLFSVFSWIFSQRAGLKLYLFVALPFLVLVSNYNIGLVLNNRLEPDKYDKAGMFAKNYLNNEQISNVVVVGSEPSSVFRTLYHLDNPDASLEIIKASDKYNLESLPSGKEWALVVGEHEVLGGFFQKIPMKGYTLIRAPGEVVVDFKNDNWPGMLYRVKGLSNPEPWGTWSESDAVIFEFGAPLPEVFELHLVATAFGPNVDSEFVASVGNDSAKFSLSNKVVGKVIPFENTSKSRVLRIEIPEPTSPNSLGMNNDKRTLGIGLIEMKVLPSGDGLEM